MLDEAKRKAREKRKTLSRKKYRTTTLAGKYETTLCSIKRRARDKGLSFNLTAKYLADITPTYCPVLGLPLAHNTGVGYACDTSPSVDRILPERGYVKGNVIIVSRLANTIRSNATPKQIMSVAQFYEKLVADAPLLGDNDSSTESGAKPQQDNKRA